MYTSDEVSSKWGMLSSAELEILRSILLFNLGPKPRIVNIGAGYGTSGLLFLETVPDSDVWTVDIQDEQAPNGSLNAERTAVARAGMSGLLDDRWHQIHGDSADVGSSWADLRGDDAGIDLLFIDGDHSYGGCKNDLRLWVPFVRDGGFVAVHDYNRGPNYWRRNPHAQLTEENAAQIATSFPGVDRAVREFFQDSTFGGLMIVVDSLAVAKIRRGGIGGL